MDTGGTILITGGNSKLATRLAPKLHYDGFRPVLLVRRNAEFKEKLQNFETVSFDCRAELEEKILSVDPNVVVHTANSYATENVAWDDVIFANYEFGLSVLEILSSVDRNVLFMNISTSLPRMTNLYSLTKNIFLTESCRFANGSNVSLVHLLCEYFYGGCGLNNKFLEMVVGQISDGAQSIKLTNSKQIRDFVHVNDFSQALITLIKHSDELVNNEIICVGSGQGYELGDIARFIKKAMRSSCDLKFGSLTRRKYEGEVLIADLSRLTALGYRPQHELLTWLSNYFSEVHLAGHK